MNCANHPERERVAFCQNCGKPLCQECTRTVGSAVFCEPCLVAKLAGAGVPPNPGTYPGAPGDVNYPLTGTIPPPRPPGESNPGLAALLGFIPGVGAMYNAQYAKGVVHLIVFAILVSLANENGVFGLFIAGWVCYQVIEAYQTATARRDGTPLPNPFGLNDLGERLGFGKSWPTATHPTNPTSAPDFSTPPVAGSAGPVSTPNPGTPWGTPAASAPWDTPTSAAAHAWEGYIPPGPQTPPYGTPAAYPSAPYPIDPNLAPPSNRFPSGAIWLIGLGCLFLIGNAGIFHGFPVHRLLPFFLIGVGVWLFVHKMTETGTFADDGSPAYRYRLFSAIRGSIWVVLVGILFLLDSFNILSWGRSWPLFIIVAGLIAIFRRMAYPAPSYPAPSYPYPAPGYPAPGYPAPVASPPPAAPVAPIVPPTPHDQEGS